YFLLTLQYFYVTQVTVLGNNHIKVDETKAANGVDRATIFSVQCDEGQNNILMNFSELIPAEENVYLPNHVYITVTEREPVILWQQDGGYTWIDSTGVAFRPRGIAENLMFVNALDVPPMGVSTDEGPTPYIQKDLVEAITLLSSVKPADAT